MKKYIVLLRGINVSGKNKLPMAELRELLNDLGFKNVKTYIQSGNIILESEKLKSEICKIIKDGVFTKFGYEVPVIARTIPEWEKVIDSYPFSIENEKIVAFSFLNKVPEETIIEIKNIGEDKYKVDNDVLYLNCPSGFGKTKLTNNTIEKKLKVIATTRNLRTTLKLLELAK
ncbi:DUF1697 domain-containing protein [Tenacibaculum sp. 1_MG-2023]|uniref:DUF1697 domain-containing protein n=1 Tax=Tenacibaculum sp. 1_MG-2023 TaxID=3062653 RepID=UPI0026E3B639|nr:DUF1697 domain-containing protein [Tenacibaculum sp. 1_MG-2023]MDO6599623.1 DUF1697 domain-containing protein [Tenacibaculum sp. 1_MG-2023]